MKPKLIPLQYEKPSLPEVAARARSFFEVMNRRRTVRDFSPARVPAGVIEDLVRAASTAPSGAHRQPWTFVAVSDPAIKRRIRIAAEREEHENYGGRMPDEWLRALEPLGTDEHKPFLEIAPWLVVLFRQNYGLGPDGEHVRHYYVSESVGIAAGLFLTAVHQAGLVALTHTPQPDGIPPGDPAASGQRDGLPADTGGLSCRRRAGTRPAPQAARRRPADSAGVGSLHEPPLQSDDRLFDCDTLDPR